MVEIRCFLSLKLVEIKLMFPIKIVRESGFLALFYP